MTEMSVASFDLTRSGTPVAEIDLAEDWGAAGPPPPAPRLVRQNAMVASYHVDGLPARELFPPLPASAADPLVAEHVAGAHFDHPLIDRVHFDPTFYDMLYKNRYEITQIAEPIDKVAKSFKAILNFLNRDTTEANFAKHGIAVYVVPLMLPTGNTWKFQTCVNARAKAQGGIALADLGIREDLALAYMACDFLKQTFVNRLYFRSSIRSVATPAVIAEINTILTRQCELHVELCGHIVK